MAPPDRSIIDVSAALVFRRGQLLIAQRPPGTHLAGLWEFPGGKREPGESWEDCLRRELLEELGVEVRVGSLYQEIRHDYPEKTVHLRFFLCDIAAPGEPLALGCSQVAWISREAMEAYAFPPADAALLERLRSDDSLWEPLG